MNPITARRLWLTWRSDIGAGVFLVIFMVAGFVLADGVAHLVLWMRAP